MAHQFTGLAQPVCPLKIPFALTIGLIGGLLELIPYVGGKVAGLAGLFFAVPAALVILAIFKEAQILKTAEDAGTSF
jgi:predicted PurR-regulated permease PerM